MKKANKSNRKDLLKYFAALIIFLILYLALFTSIFDTKTIIHDTDGEELYYLTQLPTLLAGHPTVLGSPFLRVGTATLAVLISGATGLTRFNSIIYLNILLYFLLASFLFWTAVPKFIEYVRTKDTPLNRVLITLLVMTIPPMTKYIFSIHPDIFMFAIFIVVAYAMITYTGIKKWWAILALCLSTLFFKENIMPLMLFFIVYFIDGKKLERKNILKSLLFVGIMIAVYWFIFVYSYAKVAYLITNKLFTHFGPFTQQIEYTGLFNVLQRSGWRYFLSVYFYKMVLVYGVLWIWILKVFFDFQKNQKRISWLLNWFYALIGVGIYTIASTSGGIGEKYFLFFTMLPLFYLFFIRNKVRIDLTSPKVRKYIIFIIIFNMINLFFYFLMESFQYLR